MGGLKYKSGNLKKKKKKEENKPEMHMVIEAELLTSMSGIQHH